MPRRSAESRDTMATDLSEIDPGAQCPEVVRMVVEIPKNSHSKYEYDRVLGVFKLDRTLYSPLHYPGDYGFIPGTLADDGDPLDVLALVGDSSFPGIVMAIRPVGVLVMTDQGKPDAKILAVPDQDPRYAQVRTVEDVFPHNLRELEYFFTIYKELEGKKTQVNEWRGRGDAHRMIASARDEYVQRSKKER